MSEYEIFGEDEEFEPMPKQEKKETIYKEKKQCCFNSFFKELFSLNNVSLFLSICSIFLTLILGLTTLVAKTKGAFIAVAIFFVFGFMLGFAGLIVEIVKMVKQKHFSFSVHFVLSIVSLFLICFVGPLTTNLYPVL